MKKQFELPSGKYVVVKVPDGAYRFRVERKVRATVLTYLLKQKIVQPITESIEVINQIELGSVNEGFKLIAPIKEITEEQAAMIVEKLNNGRYLNYLKEYNSHKDMFETSIESFYSLMQSLEIYSVNPYGEKAPKTDDYFIKSTIHNPLTEELERYYLASTKWELAQEKVANYVLLKKI